MPSERMRGFVLLLLAAGFMLAVASNAQEPVILGPAELEKLVPTNFYFEGQLGPTQMRNSVAIRFGERHNFIVALVDTSGYASAIRGKYEGFIITDAKFSLRHASSGGGMGTGSTVQVPAGAYGFGFTEDLKMNIFDVGGNKLHTISVTRDDKLKAPRPLAVLKSGNEFRLYRGRAYVVVTPN